METNLQELINKPTDEISWYLEDVSVSDFKLHVTALIKSVTDKGAIKTAIEKLQSLL